MSQRPVVTITGNPWKARESICPQAKSKKANSLVANINTKRINH